MALYNDPDEGWALAVGRFVLAFGDIEHTSIRCLQKLARAELPGEPAVMAPKGRLKLLGQMLESIEGRAARELLLVVRRLLDLVNTRNLIAHNGLNLLGSHHFTESDGAMRIVFETALQSARRPALVLTLPALQELAEAAEDLAWSFTTAAHTAFVEIPWVDYEP